MMANPWKGGDMRHRARVVGVMGRDEHKPVGYWLIKDGERKWVETKPAATNHTDIHREMQRNRRCRTCATRLDIPKVQRVREGWAVELVCWRCGYGETEIVPYIP